MAIPNTSEKSNALDREESVTRGNLSAKRVVVYTYDAATDTLLPVTSTKEIKFATVSANTGGDNQIVAGVTSKKIKVLSAVLVSSGTVSVKWRSNTTDKSGAMPLVANSGFVLPASSPGQGHYVETASGEALNINLSGGVQVSGHITYFEEA